MAMMTGEHRSDRACLNKESDTFISVIDLSGRSGEYSLSSHSLSLNLDVTTYDVLMLILYYENTGKYGPRK